MASNHPSVISTRVGQSIILTLGADLSGGVLDEVKKTALEDLHRHRARGVIFEISALQFLDTHEFDELKAIAKMVEVLGATAIFAGFRPGIVMYLIESGVDLGNIKACFGLDEALEQLASLSHAVNHD